MRTPFKIVLGTIAALLTIPPLNHASPEIAFMGDSLTQGWDFPRANFGVYGQTTEQMLARFPNQIPYRDFRTVVILGGTNDTLLGIDPSATISNLNRMVNLAHASGVEPVLAEIPPIYKQDGHFLPAVERLNAAIVALASLRHVRLVDYYDALLNHPDCYSDGIHLKRRGYVRMELALIHEENPF